jgi:hypothetical protein
LFGHTEKFLPVGPKGKAEILKKKTVNSRFNKGRQFVTTQPKFMNEAVTQQSRRLH